ncbi:MAG: aminotransferase class IV [Schwartzia sp.]|nr:aminotransferase class IV [Schwartzia sp. (in: firmicutes)]
MKELAYYDGAFLPLDTYAVHLEDRGFQFGDGVFETIRVYDGKCFALKEHLERYRRSMRELAIPITDADAELVGVFYELIEKTEIKDGIIYFQLTRGTSPRSYLPPKINLPHLGVVIRDVPIHTDWQEKGIRAALVEDIRWLRCDIASLNLLGSVLAAEEARKKNAKKALFFRKEKNTVTEGEDANFFVVKDEVLWTHPANEMILSGVTRAIVKEKLAPALGLTVVEKTLTPDFVKGAEEAFFTNTADEIVPVTMIDRDPIADGAPGQITKKLLAAYKEHVKEELAKPMEE